jgi:hypothetical protein
MTNKLLDRFRLDGKVAIVTGTSKGRRWADFLEQEGKLEFIAAVRYT